MPKNRRFAVPAAKSSLAVVATAAIAVTGLSFGAAAAHAADPSNTATPDAGTISTANGWIVNDSHDAFDWDSTPGTNGASGTFRLSNWVNDQARYSDQLQIETPAIAAAGETSSGASNNTFTEQFTLGAETYAAQPDLAVEVDADTGYNRAGGNLVLRQDTAGQLELTNYYFVEDPQSDDGGEWKNADASIPFTKPVQIKYVAHFIDDGTDIVKVYADGKLVLSGSTFEGYHDVVEGDKESVTAVNFRTAFRKPVPGGAWEDSYPTTDELANLKGKGFDFSDISLTSSDSVTAPTATPTVVQYANIGQETAAGYPDSAIFVGAPNTDADHPSVNGVTATGGLELGDRTQILHAFPADARPTDLTGFIDSGLSWDQTGDPSDGVSFQIPLTYGPNDQFTTLRTAAIQPGKGTAQWDDQWISSHGGATGTLGQLVSSIEQQGNVHVFGYGIYADKAVDVNSIQAGSQEFTFADSPAITVDGVTLSDTTPQVGEKITATPGAASITSAALTYQWSAGGKKISGATHADYTPVAGDLGKALSVTVTASKTGYTSGTATATSSAVAAGDLGETSVSLSGTPEFGKTLTSTVTAPSTAGLAYQWYRDGTTKIAGATKSTYKATTDDLASTLSVHVRVSQAGYTSQLDTATATATVGASSALQVTSVTVHGTREVGKVIFASAKTSVKPDSLLYIWSIGGFGGGITLKASTSDTLKVPAAAKGKVITVFVIATKLGYQEAENGTGAQIR